MWYYLQGQAMLEGHGQRILGAPTDHFSFVTLLRLCIKSFSRSKKFGDESHFSTKDDFSLKLVENDKQFVNFY